MRKIKINLVLIILENIEIYNKFYKIANIYNRI